MTLRGQLITSSEFSSVADFTPAAGSYLYQVSGEERSEHVDSLRARVANVSFIQLTSSTRDTATTGGGQLLDLRRARETQAFLRNLGDAPLYIDITGMSHEIWAPLVRAALELRADVKVVYVEPESYARSAAPRRGDIFDLSERVVGIAPIPTFASIAGPSGVACFVALLGFEGARFSLMLTETEPPADRIYPIVGVPGFRPEYPFHSVLGNAVPLSRTRSHHRIRYARSNCPFSAYYTLDEIRSRHPDGVMQIAMVGTKPHALAAVLYALFHSGQVELLYDYVIRKPARTQGSEHCFLYDLDQFRHVVC